MSLQADETPCTLLCNVNGQLLDVAKGTIAKPCDRLFHGRPMPANAYRVSVTRVMLSHESLPLPLRAGGEDDESPTMLGQCKSWPLLWLKNLIRVDAPGSTPMAAPTEGKTNPPILTKTNVPIQLAPWMKKMTFTSTSILGTIWMILRCLIWQRRNVLLLPARSLCSANPPRTRLQMPALRMNQPRLVQC